MKDLVREDMIACRTPAKGRTAVSPVPRWKFDAVRRAILDAVKSAGPEGLPFARLPNAVRDRLGQAAAEELGSLGWHVTTVKLELEVQGEIARKAGVVPQQLIAT